MVEKITLLVLAPSHWVIGIGLDYTELFSPVNYPLHLQSHMPSLCAYFHLVFLLHFCLLPGIHSSGILLRMPSSSLLINCPFNGSSLLMVPFAIPLKCLFCILSFKYLFWILSFFSLVSLNGRVTGYFN